MSVGVSEVLVDVGGEDALGALREHLAPEAFREMVALYETTVKDRAAALADAADRHDVDALRRNAHDLAGMCGQLGASHATALARRIEGACAAGEPDRALALAAELRPAVAETLAALAELDQ
jgi:HPt (histidine-containing phosphotransfer) domain-containing protein